MVMTLFLFHRFNQLPVPSVFKNSSEEVPLTLCMDNVSSKDMNFLDNLFYTPHINVEFNGYNAEHGDDSISFSPIQSVPVPSVFEDSIEEALLTLCTDNVSLKDMDFLDNPFNTPHINTDFIGNNDEQVCSDDFIPFSPIESMPSLTNNMRNYMAGKGQIALKKILNVMHAKKTFSRDFDLERHMDSLRNNKKIQ